MAQDYKLLLQQKNHKLVNVRPKMYLSTKFQQKSQNVQLSSFIVHFSEQICQ